MKTSNTLESGNKIISHSSIYLLGSILQRSVSFIMLPIYTRCLTPADYGTLELLSMVLDFMSIMLGLRVGEAIFRFYAKYNHEHDKKQVITTALYLVSMLNLIGFAFVALFAKPLSLMVFGSNENYFLLALFSGTLLSQGFIEIPMAFMRARQKPWLFVTFSVIKLSLQLCLNIYFVVIHKMHVEGVIYAALLSSGVVALLLGCYTFSITGWRASKNQAKQLVSFSIPLILTSMVSFYITFGDRYFLRLFGGLADVGVYSLGYKFGFMLMFLVVQPFNNIWDSEKYKIHKKENARSQYRDVFINFNLILFVVVLLISLFVKDLLIIMANENFWLAYKIVPIILAAYVTNAWTGFVNFGILVENKTIEITYGTVLAAGVVTIGYLVLIPIFGTAGAAWATVCAFGARCVWVYFRAKRLYDLGLQWYPVCALAIIYLLACFVSLYSPKDTFLSILFNLLVAFLACISIIFLPVLPEKQRKMVISFFKNPRDFKLLFSK